MTGGTIGRGRMANGGADKSSCAGIMTAGTRVMRFRGGAYKCVIMAVSTAGCTYRDAGMAVPGCRMKSLPRCPYDRWYSRSGSDCQWPSQ